MITLKKKIVCDRQTEAVRDWLGPPLPRGQGLGRCGHPVRGGGQCGLQPVARGVEREG